MEVEEEAHVQTTPGSLIQMEVPTEEVAPGGLHGVGVQEIGTTGVFRSPSRGDDGESNNPGNNLHVSGLSNKVDSRDLEAAFTKIGRVIKAQVVYDPHTRESRLFGFVTMQSADEAEAAVAALNATEFMGKVMTVAKARRGRARTPTPGRYHGPSKRSGNTFDRPYDPRPYDSRYARDYDDRRGGRGGRYDRDRGKYDDRDRDRGERGDRYRDYDRDRERDRDYRRDDRERRYDDRDRERRY
ncbi:hypothetical protein AAF712_008949 [Marasmius tenuissimus]|uniref:RRM domain-containing protein n=1 Tax=Marasmius tenuissimus TaxID=585030 RepID=A0ABR2ZTB4_9AGAR